MSDERSTQNRAAPAENDDASAAFSRWQREIRDALRDAEAARLDVYVRSMMPPPGAKDTQQNLLHDLQKLVEGTPIQNVGVNVWGERICLCETCRETDVGTAMLNTVREFEHWGEEYDAGTGSFFERLYQQSLVTGNSYEGISPPRVTVALYVDNSLSGVFPSYFAGEPYSVHDFYEWLAPVADSSTVAERVQSSP